MVLTDDEIADMSLYSCPDSDTPRNTHLVSEVLKRDIAHNFGSDTDTGVTYVSMLILLLKYEPLGKVETGHVKDQTGIDIGGGGTTDVDAGVLYRL